MKLFTQRRRHEMAPDSVSPARRRRILVAERDATLRRPLVEALRGDGYDVIEARDGFELLDQLGNAILDGAPGDGPDAIIMDSTIPGVSAISILDALRDAEWPSPVVLLMGERSPGARYEPAGSGASVIFQRPFDIDDLRTVMFSIVPRTDYRTPTLTSTT